MLIYNKRVKNMTKNDLVAIIMLFPILVMFIIGILEFGFFEVVQTIAFLLLIMIITLLLVFCLYKLMRWMDEHGDEPVFKNKK